MDLGLNCDQTDLRSHSNNHMVEVGGGGFRRVEGGSYRHQSSRAVIRNHCTLVQLSLLRVVSLRTRQSSLMTDGPPLRPRLLPHSSPTPHPHSLRPGFTEPSVLINPKDLWVTLTETPLSHPDPNPASVSETDTKAAPPGGSH